MAFLDNSGDIILDAVLTDTGRFRMARGDFKITKFALADDEIDYSLYNANHPSGSSYYDLEILKTPVLEAFTNNTSMMKSKLLTVARTNILHMPILKLSDGGHKRTAAAAASTKLNNSLSTYIVTCDSNTENVGNSLVDNATEGQGIIRAAGDGIGAATSATIRVEHGLDTLKIPPTFNLPSDLLENQFIIEMDDRLGHLASTNGNQVPVSFIDDDQIASYYVGAGVGAGLVRSRLDVRRGDGTQDGTNLPTEHVIRGPRGRVLEFKIRPNINLTNSTYLFEKLGTTVTTAGDDDATIDGFKSGITLYYVDTFVRVTAATTGYSINVPVRYVKKQG